MRIWSTTGRVIDGLLKGNNTVTRVKILTIRTPVYSQDLASSMTVVLVTVGPISAPHCVAMST